MSAVLPSPLTEELVALRRRAYGPDADIEADPAALARLAELEGRGPTQRVDTLVPAAAAPSSVDAEPGEPSSTEGGVAADPGPPADSEPSHPRWWRRPALLVAAAVVALVVLAASVMMTLDARPDRTLTPTPTSAEIPFPDGFSWLTSALGIPRDALRSYRGVGDIIVWAGTAEDGVACLLVTGTDGPFGFGCARGGRDATADIVLDSKMASIPPTGLPERTTLRFVYRGDTVDVWIDEP